MRFSREDAEAADANAKAAAEVLATAAAAATAFAATTATAAAAKAKARTDSTRDEGANDSTTASNVTEIDASSGMVSNGGSSSSFPTAAVVVVATAPAAVVSDDTRSEAITAVREAKAARSAARALEVAALMRLAVALAGTADEDEGRAAGVEGGADKWRSDALAAGSQAWDLRAWSAAAASSGPTSLEQQQSPPPPPPGSPTELCVGWSTLLSLLGRLHADIGKEKEKGTSSSNNAGQEAAKWYTLAAEAAAEAGEFGAADKYQQLATKLGGEAD